MAKKGHSRQTLFGYVNHYDSSGKKIGRSRRGLLGDDWVHYDEKGKRAAVTRNGILGGTYTTDVHGKRIGYSRENLVGGTNYYDTHGHLVGRSRDNLLNGSTDSEGFANQTSTRAAERIMIAQPIVMTMISVMKRMKRSIRLKTNRIVLISDAVFSLQYLSLRPYLLAER